MVKSVPGPNAPPDTRRSVSRRWSTRCGSSRHLRCRSVANARILPDIHIEVMALDHHLQHCSATITRHPPGTQYRNEDHNGKPIAWIAHLAQEILPPREVGRLYHFSVGDGGAASSDNPDGDGWARVRARPPPGVRAPQRPRRRGRGPRRALPPPRPARREAGSAWP